MKCAVARLFYKVYFKNGFWSATIHLPLGKASSLEMGRPGEDVWVAGESGCGWGRGSHRDLPTVLCTLCPGLREVWQHGAQARSVLGFLDVRRLTDSAEATQSAGFVWAPPHQLQKGVVWPGWPQRAYWLPHRRAGHLSWVSFSLSPVLPSQQKSGDYHEETGWENDDNRQERILVLMELLVYGVGETMEYRDPNQETNE